MAIEVSLSEGYNSFQTIKNLSTQAARSAFNKVAEATDKKDFLTEAAAKTADVVVAGTNKAVDTVTRTADRAKDALVKTAEKALDTATVASGKIAKQTGDSLKGSVEDTFQKADRLSDAAYTAVENAIATFIDRKLDAVKFWIDAHPAVSWITKALLWGIDRPIISTFIIFLAVFILWQLFKAFGSFVEKGLLHILLAPFKLIKFLLQASFKPLGKFAVRRMTRQQPEANVPTLKTAIFASISYDRKERLAHIMTRLEEIRHEQNELLQEVTAILASEQPTLSGLEPTKEF